MLQDLQRVAVRRRRNAQELVENALRNYLDTEHLERVWERSTLSEEEALELAYEELHAERSGR